MGNSCLCFCGRTTSGRPRSIVLIVRLETCVSFQTSSCRSKFVMQKLTYRRITVWFKLLNLWCTSGCSQIVSGWTGNGDFWGAYKAIFFFESGACVKFGNAVIFVICEQRHLLFVSLCWCSLQKAQLGIVFCISVNMILPEFRRYAYLRDCSWR